MSTPKPKQPAVSATSSRSTTSSSNSIAREAKQPPSGRQTDRSSGALKSTPSKPQSAAVRSNSNSAASMDRLTTTTPHVLYLMLSYLTMNEVCVLSRSNRFLLAMTSSEEHPLVWRKRFLTWIKKPPPRPVTKKPMEPIIEKQFVNEKGLSPIGLKHFQQLAQQHSILPNHLVPHPSAYRYALLSIVRKHETKKFATFLTRYHRNDKSIGVTRPIIERVMIKFQVNLGVSTNGLTSNQQLWRRNVDTYLHDNTVVCCWKGMGGLSMQQLKRIQLMGFSGAIMQSFQLADLDLSSNRSWSILRSGVNEQTLSLLEFNLNANEAKMSSTTASSSSPFEPNQYARAKQQAVSASTSSSSSTQSKSRSSENILPIPGMNVQVCVGVWGPCSSSGPTSQEIAFIWIAIPHSLIIASLPIRKPSLSSLDWTVEPDDLDSNYGLHDYYVNFSLRSMTTTICSWFFQGVHMELDRLVESSSFRPPASSVRLRLPSIRALIPPFNKLPGLPWKTEMWSGRFDRMCILDLVVRYRQRDLWIISVPIQLQPLTAATDGSSTASTHIEFDEAHSQTFVGAYDEPGVGQVEFQLIHTPNIHASADGQRHSSSTGKTDEGVTEVLSLSIQMDTQFIDQYFHTCYSAIGSASKSHYLQTAARSTMTKDQQRQYQVQQLGLRDSLEPSFPAPSLPRNYVAPARPGAASSSTSSTSSSSTTTATARPPRNDSKRVNTRREWVDIAPPVAEQGERDFQF